MYTQTKQVEKEGMEEVGIDDTDLQEKLISRKKMQWHIFIFGKCVNRIFGLLDSRKHMIPHGRFH